MKRLRWHVWATVLGCIALLSELYAFAGLQRHPRILSAVDAQAILEAPLMHTYIVGGRYLLQATPFMRDASAGLADRAWSDAYAAIRANPMLAADLLQARAHGVVHAVLQLCYWGAPALLLIALAGWTFRPRRVSLIRNDSG